MLNGNRTSQVAGADSVSASPGFTWGRSGNATSSTYLLNDTVPSNISGRLIPLNDSIISEIFVTCQNNATCVIAVERRVGAVYTELATITLTAERKKVVSYSVGVDYLDEICVKVKSGSLQNPVVGVVVKGDST